MQLKRRKQIVEGLLGLAELLFASAVILCPELKSPYKRGERRQRVFKEGPINEN